MGEVKYINVIWLKPHHLYAYNKDDKGIVDSEKAPGLLAAGFILPIPDTESKIEKVNPLPADLPGRTVLFDAGFDTIQKIKEAGDSLLDAGISNTTLKKVKAYVLK
jgi:hypothetical protein